MRRSPIEMMIDAACGIPDGLPEVDGRSADGAWLILWCPLCDRMQATERMPHDPPTATLLELGCPECIGGDFDHGPFYSDGNGHEVTDQATG